MSIIYLSGAWVAGIFLGSKLNVPPALIFVGLMPLLLLFFTREHKKPVILVTFCLIALFGGGIYFQSRLPTIDENYLQFYNDQGTVEIRGVVARDPEIGKKTTHLRLSAENTTLGGESHNVTGTALLFVPRYPAYSYGDVLLVTGKLATPSQLDDFDYRGYLAHQEIYSTMLYPEIEILETGKGFRLLSWVYSLRNKLSQTLAEVLPEPQAALAQGIILGIRGNIPSSVNADFINSGTAHLLAISGLNLSIVAGILLSFGIWLFGRRGYLYIWLALGTIWLYALLTGMQPPVFRATIMASLFLTAELLGRQRSAPTALVMAAAVMVSISPQVLWDAAFQMSFVAMVGLIFIFPRLQSLGRKAVSATLGEDGRAVSLANLVTDSFSVTLGALLAVWPLIAYYFGIISWVAPLATLLASLALPGIIVTGVLAAGLGLFAMPLAQVAGWLVWLLASYMLFVVKALAVIPVIESRSVDSTLVWIYYSALALVIWLHNQRRKFNLMPKAINFVSQIPRKWVIPPLVVVAILVWLTAATMPDDRLRISFLDVGQGDAALIQKGNQQILVDGGPDPQVINLALGKKMPFWDRTIDLVVLTHPHADHLAGLVEVLNRYQVKQVLYADLEYDSPLYHEWLKHIQDKSVKYTLAQAGQEISLGTQVIIEVVNPQIPHLAKTNSDTDNNGVVLRLKAGGVSFLLTGDIMWEAEFELIARRAELTSTVLKVAHHGSTTSTTAEFLAVVNPRLAIISVGEDNPFGHPNKNVRDRLEEKLGQEKIYYTSKNDTIEFITDGERLWVRAGRP